MSLIGKQLREIVSVWLTESMVDRWNDTTLAAASGVARETIWRIRTKRTDAEDETLSKLADAMKVPFPQLLVADPRTVTTDRVSEASQGDADSLEPGWMFGDPAAAEEQFNRLLRDQDRTVRAMVGDPDVVSKEEIRLNQLAICRAAQKACEMKGRPVPEFIKRSYDAIIAGTFR
jgi:hypothetical protein